MAIKFGSDGTLYCNTVKYNYKQAKNLISNGCFCADYTTAEDVITAWTNSYCRTLPLQGGSGSNMSLAFQNFDYEDDVTAMSEQPMPKPIANHKYYGAMMYMTGSGFSAADARFEWFIGDGDNQKMTFVQKVNTNNNWVKASSILSLSSPASGSWRIRNFVRRGTKPCYCTKLMIVDLTDTFGSGNEPSKAWCDENILEWKSFYMIPETETCRGTNYDTEYTFSNLGTTRRFGYNNNNSSSLPRDFYYTIDGLASAREGYINSQTNMSINPNYKYYGFLDVRFPFYNKASNLSMDIYCPIAEPLLGQTPLVAHENYNGGGPMASWKRVSMLRDRSSFTSGSYPQRFDFNNQNTTNLDGANNSIWVTNFGIVNLYTFEVATRLFASSPDGWSRTSDYNNLFTKPFMDRRYGGYLMPIIRIPDPSKKQIKFNTNYDIVCNDIIPDPGNNKVWFDINGRIHCKTIITDQVY